MDSNADAIKLEDSTATVDSVENTTESPAKSSRLKPLWSAGTILFSLTAIITDLLLEFVWDWNWSDRVGWAFMGEEMLNTLLIIPAVFALFFRGWISFIITGLICWYFVSTYIIPWFAK